VRARQQPRASSPVLTTLSFDVVRRAGASGPDASGWSSVQLSDGRRAYVASAFVRSPTDYRAGFVRRQGRWLLRTLVAGD
jgi:hypothetical protein